MTYGQELVNDHDLLIRTNDQEVELIVYNYYTSLASITVPTPTVSACLGTLLRSLSKNRAFATTVSLARVLRRVLDTSDDPGSLKAM